jgi:hypothetical protein
MQWYHGKIEQLLIRAIDLGPCPNHRATERAGGPAHANPA